MYECYIYMCALTCVCVYVCLCVSSLLNLHPSAGGPPLPVRRPVVPARSAVPDLTVGGYVCVRVFVCMWGCLMSLVPYEVVSLKQREEANG